MSMFINNPKYSDLKIVSMDDQVIYAHKLIVCHQCSVLDTMITIEKEIKMDVPYDILLTFISYLYTGSTIINDNNVMPLYLLSDQYIIALKQDCEKYLSLKLTIDNIFNYYVLANTHNSPYLSDCCIKWMNNHYKEVVNHSSFYDLDKHFIQKILNSLSK